MSKRMRFGRWALLVAVVLVLVVTAGALSAVRASAPTTSGELRLPGLSAAVTVRRDSYGVPQLYANTATDLFRAQGYVHAQDRFWEMDFRRHVTAGRLAEMFGAGQVTTDAVIRTMGWRRTAAAEWKLMTPSSRAYLTAYAAGVNAYLADHSGLAASLEYGVLALSAPDYRIEPWTPIDSLAWLKAMAWDLRSNLPDELGRAELSAHGVPRERIEQLWPAYPFRTHAPIVAGDNPAENGSPVRSASASDTRPAVVDKPAGAAFTAVRRALRAVPSGADGGAGAGIGSNSWVVGSGRTATGKPLLANDPHLAPSMPGIWYQVGLHCRRLSAACPYAVTGFSFSGMPGVVIGHNNRIGWGFTNLGPDVTDLYLEDVAGGRYRVGQTWRPLSVRRETIKVAGGSSRTITVRATGHGPLLSDVDTAFRGAGGRYSVALRWTALTPNRTMDSLFAMNQARTWDQFRAAAKLFAAPAQNLVYADVDGNIGYQAPGEIPTRAKGDGRWPAPGWDPAYDWTGRIPYERLPSVKNPPEGFVATANQAVIGPGYQYPLTSDWSAGYRSQRIRDLLAGANRKLTSADMSRIQLDDRSSNAADVVPSLLRAPVTGQTRLAQNLLRGWDFRQPVESAPAAFFNATWRHLLVDTFDDDLPAGDREQVDGGERWFQVVGQLLAQPASPWWDDRRTATVERRDDILSRAMTEASAELRADQGEDPLRWRWGTMHRLDLRNSSLGESGIAPVEWLFNRGPYEVGGGGGLVNATSWRAPKGYGVSASPSMRMVLDFADLDRSRWINLTGTSGHAFDEHYDDQTPLWQRGATIPMPFTEPAVKKAARETLILSGS